jgi:hypothetical protein
MSSKEDVNVTYTHGGTQPPIYLAGTFNGWSPQEMDFTIADDGEYHFSKKLQVEAGQEYQYKFRVGPGDWWVLDEDAPVSKYILSHKLL